MPCDKQSILPYFIRDKFLAIHGINVTIQRGDFYPRIYASYANLNFEDGCLERRPIQPLLPRQRRKSFGPAGSSSRRLKTFFPIAYSRPFADPGFFVCR